MGDPNGLTDNGPGFIGPLLIVVAIIVFILLILGLFMPNASMEF
jgi:hypothetical protein